MAVNGGHAGTKKRPQLGPRNLQGPPTHRVRKLPQQQKNPETLKSLRISPSLVALE